MHFEKIEYCNIKGRSGKYDLSPLTVITGPNRSGKSAFLDACRLAATGRCSVGAGGRYISRIISDDAAQATLTSESVSSGWNILIGDTVSVSKGDYGMQGGLPATVGEFWALTAEQRLGILGAGGQLDEIESASAGIKERLKELDVQIATPSPPTPPPYNGEPVGVLEQKMAECSVAIAKHDEAVVYREQASARATAAKQLLSQYDVKRRELEEETRRIQSTLKFLQGESDAAIPIIREYEAALAARPAIVNGYSSFNKLIADVIDAVVWADTEKSSEVATAIGMLGHIDIPIPIPSVVFDKLDALHAMGGLHPQKWHTGLVSEIASLHDEQSRVTMQLELLTAEQAQAELELSPEETRNVMADEAYIARVELLEDLREQHRAAQEWAMFDKRTGEWSVVRAKAVREHNNLSKDLDDLRTEKARLVDVLKSGVETTANEMLERVGLEGVMLSVSCSGKRSSLQISVGGIDIEALAMSERLVYGLCLLSAIHRHSDAECPLLVAECAEMDENMMKLIVDALGTPENGNIILEHWCDVGLPNSVVMKIQGDAGEND